MIVRSQAQEVRATAAAAIAALDRIESLSKMLFDEVQPLYQTTVLGNELRRTAERIRVEYAERSEASFAELRQFLDSLVQASDKRLVEGALLPQSPRAHRPA